MNDPKKMLDYPEQYAEALLKKGYKLDIEAFLALQTQRKNLLVETQALQQQRNTLSKEVGLRKAKGLDCEQLLTDLSVISESAKFSQQKLTEVQSSWEALEYSIPNCPDSSVPLGDNELENVEMRRWGEPRVFHFDIKDHVELGENLKLLDFETASKLSGSRFVVMHKQLARLQRALIQFMLDRHTLEHGYQEVYVPYLLKEECFYGTGQLPKFREEQFFVEGGEMALLPTAEVPVTNLWRDSIVDAEQLPLQYVAHTPCFRREAGSYGKDTRGLIRQHQFEKVELLWFTRPETSYTVLEELTQHAENILQQLELPYRVVSLCGGDLGFSAAKTYDLEVWIPSQNSYREISSCSNCVDFQARRMQTRWRNPKTGKPELLHTLNGSGLAVGRTLVAIMENYQDEKGSIRIPTALVPYCSFSEITLP